MNRNRARTATLAAIAVVSLTILRPPTPAAATVPADFDKTEVVSGLDTPTAFRFAPDGRIFIAEQGGAIRVVENGVLRSAPLATLPTANTDERGLLGIELDPNFATNGYLYAAYTHADNMDRLSRFTVTGYTLDLGSEKVLLASNQQANVFHHGGEVRFGPDGKLYWALGMNLYNPNSQNLGTIHGKILRINSDGSIPTDNPFVNTPGAEPAIWAYGLRNPFRFDVVPNGPNAGKLLAGDVGGSKYEELDLISKGGNYGWPAAEGFCTGCGYINPVYAYPHTDPPASAGSITAVAVYTGTTFPSQYHNAVFFGDYTLGFIKYLVMDDEYGSVVSVHDFDLNAGTPVQLSVGPDGNLYQLNIYPGVLYKIAPSGGNRAPVAVASGTPTDGLAPLKVKFSSAGSADPDGTPVTYAWDFKDGKTSTAANPSHTFTTNGVHNVTLTVSDGQKTATAVVPVTVGNRRPTGTITSPTDEAHYNAGDVINYSATASDPEDGALPASAYSWSVIFHHADHIHPFLGPIDGVTSGSFTIPRNADNVATTWYEIQLTVRDSGGLSQVSSVDIRPNLVTLTFGSNPAGLEYTVDGLPYTGTVTETAVVGVDRVLGTTSPQFLGGVQYAYAGWSDGGAQTHTVRTPASNITYQVNFSELAQPPAPWATDDIGARTVSGTTAYQGGTFTIAGGGNDIWAGTDEFRYVHQPFSGDGSIVARVTAQGNTDPWAKSGIMIKETATAGAHYAAVAVTPANGMHFQYDFTGDSGTQPYTIPDGWMKLTRVGDTFTAYRSSDGVTWTAIGTATVPMTANVTAGLFVSAHNDTMLNTSVFDNVTVRNSTSGTLPSPWQRVDVGGASPPGAATSDGSTFTVEGGGTDVWGGADQSSLVWRTLDGDGSIVARVTSQEATDGWAKAGIMIKKSTTAGAPYAAMLVTPEHGVHFQANFTSDTGGAAYTFPNAWLKLTRSGTSVSGYQSTNGTDWTLVGQTTVDLSTQVVVGLFVNAHNGGTALGTATFDNVNVAADTTLPSPWVSEDVGSPALAGSATYAGGTFTVLGSGADVWGGADEFHFVDQALSGDGTLVARVAGQDNTNEWAKTGIMIKESSAAGSPYVALLATPGHGVHLQGTTMRDIAGSATTAPRWLKLTRTGSTFTGYESANGTTWTTVGSLTVAMTSGARAGLFVTAHDPAAVNTSTFDNVTLTAAGGSALPAGWNHQDVGGSALAGSAVLDGRGYVEAGAGCSIPQTARAKSTTSANGYSTCNASLRSDNEELGAAREAHRRLMAEINRA